ncbi:MAG: ATP-dependent DNA helicase RecG, partial [Pseudomonadota bacterium]
MARPEILFPLFAELDGLKGVGPKAGKAFERLGITRLRDLLFHLPAGIVDRRPVATLQGQRPGATVTLTVTVQRHTSPRRRGVPYRVSVEGGGTLFELVFFRAQGDWLSHRLPIGARRVISGKLDLYDGAWQMAHPDLVITEEEAETLPPFEPVYGVAEGLTQSLVARAVAQALGRSPALPEWHDPALVRREGWLDWMTALGTAHQPEG